MKALWTLLSLLLIPPVFALEVLGVVGQVVPAKPYYEKLLAKRPTGNSVEVSPSDRQRASRWAGEYRYDSGLTLGNFSSFALNQKATERLTQPLCLIGNDQDSKDWLNKSSAVLAEVGAVCYLVESTSDDNLEGLRSHAPAIRIFALDPSLIITKFSVPHYPALISKRGVEQ